MKGDGGDRHRFLRIATGSAREAKDGTAEVGIYRPAGILSERLPLLDTLIGLLVTELHYQRQRERPHRTTSPPVADPLVRRPSCSLVGQSAGIVP